MSSERTASAERLARLLERARARVRAVTPEQAREAQQRGAVLIDIRESWESVEGTAADALTVERGRLELDIGDCIGDPDRPLVASGRRVRSQAARADPDAGPPRSRSRRAA